MAVDRIGDGFALRSKGEILSHDGTNLTTLPFSDGMILTARSSATNGLSWEATPTSESQIIELVTTTTLTSGLVSSISFSNITSGYEHLMVRARVCTHNSGYQQVLMRVNNVSTASYPYHYLYADSSTVSSTQSKTESEFPIGLCNPTTTSKSGLEVFIHSYANTSYYKNINSFGCFNKGGSFPASLQAIGAFKSTSAITSLSFYISGDYFGAGTSFSLYGIKGS